MKSKIFLEMCKVRKPRNRNARLPGVLIDANGLTVTNLETTVTYRPASEGKFPFTFDLDDEKAETLAKTAKEIEISSFPNAVDRKAQIEADGVKVEIPCVPLEEFPPIPDPAERKAFEVFEMPWAEFCEKGMRAAEFTAKVSHASVLEGVYFDFPGENKPGSFVATDGKRLAILKGPETDREFKVIIPTGFFKLFYQITKTEKPETVRIFANEKEVEIPKTYTASGEVISEARKETQVACLWIEAGNFLFNQLMIDGQFPDYRRVFPSSEPVMTTTIGPAQKSTIDKACKFADEGHGVEFYKDKLKVKDVEFPQVFTLEGEMEFRPMFNAGFLSDFTDEDFDVEIYGHDKPMMLHAPDACYLVMPIVGKSNDKPPRFDGTSEPEPEKVEFNGVMEATPVENPAA